MKMKRIFRIIILLSLVLSVNNGVAAISDSETVKQRVVDALMLSEVDDNEIESLLDSFQGGRYLARNKLFRCFPYGL